MESRPNLRESKVHLMCAFEASFQRYIYSESGRKIINAHNFPEAQTEIRKILFCLVLLKENNKYNESIYFQHKSNKIHLGCLLHINMTSFDNKKQTNNNMQFDFLLLFHKKKKKKRCADYRVEL